MPARSDSISPMPLVECLLKFTRSGRVSWHMPGHASGQDWPIWFRSVLTEMDVTELPLTDDLNNPVGPARAAMELAAVAFGAGLTRFITSGSTAALQIMLTLGVGRGGRILLPRCVHQSIMHAVALMDMDPCWLQTADLPEPAARFSLLPMTDAAAVESALNANPGCRAVFLTSPDYYGGCADLAAIAAVAHRHGALLLVDEAHGAHLCAAADMLPMAAMHAGADVCVQSGHKTLPVLTPGAYLHVSGQAIAAGRIDTADLDRLIPVFQTSSPSFPIAATLDYARAWLMFEGRPAIGRQLNYRDEFAGMLPDTIACSPGIRKPWPDLPYVRDPLRLIITGAPAGVTLPAMKMASGLAGRGLDVEFADLTRLVLIPSLQQAADTWQQLADSLRDLAAGLMSGFCCSSTSVMNLEKDWRYWLTATPHEEMKPGDALFAQHKLRRMPLAGSAGQISARAIMPYPPGIPLIWPGERLDQPRVDFLRQLMENELSITGIDQENLWVIA